MSVDKRTKRRGVTSLWIDGGLFAFDSAVLIEQWIQVEGTPPHLAGWDLDVSHSGTITDGPHALKADLEDGSTWEQNGKVEFNAPVRDGSRQLTRTNIQQA
jgi:hypothetical protein